MEEGLHQALWVGDFEEMDALLRVVRLATANTALVPPYSLVPPSHVYYCTLLSLSPRRKQCIRLGNGERR